ncbi:hypothetical protein BDQ17DRAFT_1371026 [Cyathus striatus]|nr:hypothetical protein BDQ17DRAFT_1371026 [Cyathus striatus]
MISSPSMTLAPEDDSKINFLPEVAWKVSDNQSNCGISKTIHTADVVNTSITFNYTGPSVTVHTITSASGGVFSVFVDGFDTKTPIDTNTYSRDPGDPPTPQCYPRQFPPFVESPPNFKSNPPSGHSITLTFVGPSPMAPNGTNTNATIQFDAFSIPEPNTVQASSASFAHASFEQTSFALIYSLMMGYFIYLLFI